MIGARHGNSQEFQLRLEICKTSGNVREKFLTHLCDLSTSQLQLTMAPEILSTWSSSRTAQNQTLTMMNRWNQLKFLILTNMRDLPPHHHLDAHTYGLFWLGKTLKPLSRRNNCFEYGEWHTHESERAKRRNAKRENSKNEFAHSKYRHASDIYLKWLPSFFVLGCDRLCFFSATFSSLPEIYGEARECKNVSSTDLEFQSFSVHCLSPPIHYSSTSVQSKSWLSSLFINTSHITSPKWPGMFVCSSTCVLNRGHARLFDLIRN